jgi:hypothetical protein
VCSISLPRGSFIVVVVEVVNPRRKA